MTILKDSEREFIVEENSVLLRGMLVVAVLCLLGSAALYFGQENPDMQKVKGLLFTSVFFAVFFVIFYEKSVFIFDRTGQWLRWKRYRLFRHRSGQLSFGQIESVLLQTQIGNSQGKPSRRVVIQTHEGELPLTITYDASDENETIAARIRELLKQSPETLVSDSVEALVLQGRVIDAVRFLRAEENLSLTEAKARVEEIQSGQSDSPNP